MIHAIILAGGWGRRFWPKSCRRFPKQLLCIDRRHSLIQNLFNQINSEIPKERIWVVANKEYVGNLRKQLFSLSKRNFLVEPQAKNTAAAIGLASVVIKKADPEAVTVVLSSDYLIKQKKNFLQAITAACALAKQDNVLVTIGILPQRAAQEFGYLKKGKRLKVKGKRLKVYKVEKFAEKPDIEKAKVYLQSKSYLWNSGIFVWQLSSILQAMKEYLPGLFSGLQRIEKAWGTTRYKSQLVKEYRRFKDISIDYGVLEQARNIYAVEGKFSWYDLGSWGSLAQGPFLQDRQGNIIQGLHKGIDTCGSVIFSENRHLIATVDVHDLIIVHTPEATLVCKKDRAQEVKKLTEILEKDKCFRRYL